MWQKRTEEEIADYRKKARRTRKIVAAVAGVGFALIGSFRHGHFAVARGAYPIVSWDEVPTRIPLALAVGLVVGWSIYRFWQFLFPPKRTVICTHCGKTKFDDGAMLCSCGNDFVDFETVKWVK